MYTTLRKFLYYNNISSIPLKFEKINGFRLLTFNSINGHYGIITKIEV